MPQVVEHVEQRDDGDHEHAGEHGDGERTEEGSGGQEDEEDEPAGEEARHLRPSPNALLHERARRRLRAGEAAEEGAADVGDAVSEQLLVRVDLVAVLAREHLRHRDGHDEAEQGHDGAVGEVGGRVAQPGQAGRGQAARDVAHHPHAEPLVEGAKVRREDADSDDDQLGGDGRLQVAGVAPVDALLQSDQQRDAEDRDEDIGHVDRGHVLRHLDGDQRDLADAADRPDLETEQAGHLARDDVTPGAGQEAADERRRHEGGEYAETTHAHQDLHDAGEQRHGASHAHSRRVDVIEGGASSSSFSSSRRSVDRRVETEPSHLSTHRHPDEEARDGHRPERDMARRAEEEVEEDGEEGRVEAVDSGDGREQREAEALRDVDHPDTDAGDDVSQQRLAPVVRRYHRHEGEELEQGGRLAAAGTRACRPGGLVPLEACLRPSAVAAHTLVVGRRKGRPSDAHHRR